MIERLRERRRRQRRHRIAEQRAELREFVYLDEVSVTSLLSFKLGKLPSEFTETLTNARRAEIAASVDATAPAIFKATMGSKYDSTLTEGTQVLSKSTIQATFKRLYAETRDSLTLFVVPAGADVPSEDKLRRYLDFDGTGDPMAPWLVKAEHLKRGQLAEVEVELEPDPTFHLAETVRALRDLIEDSSELFGLPNLQDMDKAFQMDQLLEKLLGGLVPLRSRLVDYVCVAINGKDHLVHRRALDRLPSTGQFESIPIYLVGVAERSLFWKDTRRLLYGKARFRVLCRLNYDGLRDAWQPVKLVDVVSYAVPDMEEGFKILTSGELLDSVRLNSRGRQKSPPKGVQVLMHFASELAEMAGIELTAAETLEIERVAIEKAGTMTSIVEGRPGFAAIVEVIVGRIGEVVDVEQMSNLRARVSRYHGLAPAGAGTAAGQPQGPRQPPEGPIGRFLDTEVIGIYW